VDGELSANSRVDSKKEEWNVLVDLIQGGQLAKL